MRPRRKLAVRKAGLPPLFLLALSLALSCCASKPTDMRTLVPAETLVYLETNDLAAALQPIIDSKPFTDVAKSKPDLSALKGVQIAVAVTGFETSEEKVNDEQSIGKIRPRFVAAIDTHAWNYQAVTFAETHINRFVVERVPDAKMGRSQKSLETGGVWIGWYGGYPEGRTFHAWVIDGVIYFGNDETAIDKCLAVRRGEADSILKTGKIRPAEIGTLARGYVSTDGVAQLSNLISAKAASELGDEQHRIAVLAILPELIRDHASDVTWASSKPFSGIEDRFTVARTQEPNDNSTNLLEQLVEAFFQDMSETPADDIAAVIGESRPETATAANTVYRSEDHVTATTFERRIISDLGFLSWLIAQLGD